MRKRIIAVLMSMALSLTMVTPAFAQDVQPKVGTTVEETDATAEGDVKTPVEDDVETPTEGDVETPVEDDVETPTEGDVETPVEDDVETPTEGDVETPVEDDVETPTEGDVETPVEDDVETPTEDDVETPVEDGEETSVEDELVVTEDTVTTLSGDQGYTGWKAVDGGWNYYENGVLVTDTFKEIYGITYYFDEWGSMLVGTFDVWDETTGEWHKMYADESGAVLFETGWYYDTEKNNWYYFKEKGILAGEEFVKIGGVDYYFDYAGRMETGSFRVWDENGELAYMMYATESGAVVYETGWYQSSDLLWYYIKEKGILASDEILEIGGAKYYFYFWGDMATGEFWYLDEDGNEVSGFAASNGVIVEENGWIIFGGKWYYMKDGSLCIGSMESVGGNYYYFDYDGVMRTGYFYGEDGYCFADASGAIYTNGWVTDGMLWYYAGPDGTF